MAFQLTELGGGVGYFKGGFYGNAKSGKTHTATICAVGIRKELGLKGPIGFFDTETGLEYVRPMILEGTGMNPVGGKSRSLSDATDFIRECVKASVSVAIIDSATHIWEEVQKSFLKQINAAREAKKQSAKTSIEWQDRGPLNDIWQKFTDEYVNSPLHLIICGRAGNIWEMSVDENGKKELNKIGTKMKTQSEMAYEPSFLAELEREQEIVDGKQVIFRTMTVLGDRFRLLDGKQFRNPTYEAIQPHIKMLTAGAKNTVDISRETVVPVAGNGDMEYSGEKRQRAIFCEEIQGYLTSVWPGQGAEEKRAKVEILHRLFQTRSWEAIQIMDAIKLKAGFDKMHEEIKKYQGEELAKMKAESDAKAKEDEAKKSGKAKKSDTIETLEGALKGGKETK